MRAGLLNKIISIEKSVRTVSKTGASAARWTDLYKGIHARVTYGKQYMAKKDANYVLTSDITFTIRYKTDITEYNRILWDGRKYRITAIRRYPERGEIQIDGELIDE